MHRLVFWCLKCDLRVCDWFFLRAADCVCVFGVWIVLIITRLLLALTHNDTVSWTHSRLWDRKPCLFSEETHRSHFFLARARAPFCPFTHTDVHCDSLSLSAWCMLCACVGGCKRASKWDCRDTCDSVHVCVFVGTFVHVCLLWLTLLC